MQEKETETEIIMATPEQAKEMQLAEREIEQRQYLEYREKLEREPESQVALDNRLLRIDARSSTERRLVPAKLPDGSIANKAIAVDKEYPEIFNEDIVKGNFNDKEVESIWGNAAMVNFLRLIGEQRGFNLKPWKKNN